MRLPILFLLVTTPVFASTAPGPAPDLEAARSALVDEVLEVTGVRGELNELGAVAAITLQYYLEKNPDAFSPKAFDDLVAVAEQAYDGKAIYAAVQKAVVAAMDDNTLTKLLDWYHSPVGKRFHAFETGGGHSAGLRDLPSFMSLGDLGPLDDERLEAAHALDRAMFLSDDQVNIVTAVYRGTRFGINEVLPKPRRLAKPQIDEELARVRFSFRDKVAKAVREGLVATFQPMKVEELSTYAEFANQPEFRIFNRLTAKAIARELDKAAIRAARDIAAYKPNTVTRTLAGVATH